MLVTCLRGYPASGKSTLARKLAESAGAFVVCRDNLRMMLFGAWWTGKREHEDAVTVAEEAAVKALLKAGESVIIDATHLEKRYLTKWVKIAAEQGADFNVVDVKVDPQVCIARDQARARNGERSVGAEVIERMAKRHPIRKWPDVQAREPLVLEPAPLYNSDLQDVILVDIDGTLAHMSGRSPYDYTRVDEDVLDNAIADLVNELGMSINIFVCSGRDDDCREVTEQWLVRNNVCHDALLMRPTNAVDIHGNKLPDWQVKYDLYNEHVRGKYNVLFVLDDRQQVVDMWRALGLKCLQVQPGDF